MDSQSQSDGSDRKGEKKSKQKGKRKKGEYELIGQPKEEEMVYVDPPSYIAPNSTCPDHNG
jgi:hypothetical protein